MWRKHATVCFFVVAFALSWGIGAIFAGVPLVAPDRLFIGGVPVAAVLVLGATGGRAALADLSRGLVRWQVGAIWYGVVAVLPVLLIGVAVLALPLVGGSQADWGNRPPFLPTALLFAVLVLLPLGAPLGEEIGWRGVALPQLLTRLGPVTASLVLGVVWSLWHLPGVLADPTLRVPAPFLLSVVPLSVTFTWIFLRTGRSLLIMVLFHAWYDLVLQCAAAVIDQNDIARLWWLLVVTQSIAAAVVGLRLRGSRP